MFTSVPVDPNENRHFNRAVGREETHLIREWRGWEKGPYSNLLQLLLVSSHPRKIVPRRKDTWDFRRVQDNSVYPKELWRSSLLTRYVEPLECIRRQVHFIAWPGFPRKVPNLSSSPCSLVLRTRQNNYSRFATHPSPRNILGLYFNRNHSCTSGIQTIPKILTFLNSVLS